MKKYLSLLFCILSAFSFCQNGSQLTELKIKGDCTHPATKTVLPELWSGFQRHSIVSYNAAGTNVGISYIQQSSRKTKTILTLCIYPKNTSTTRCSGMNFILMIMP